MSCRAGYPTAVEEALDSPSVTRSPQQSALAIPQGASWATDPLSALPHWLRSAGVAASTRVGLTDRKASLGVFGAIFGGVLGGSIQLPLEQALVPLQPHSLEPRSQMLPLQLPLQESWASQLASSEESSEQLASPSSSAEVAWVPSVCFRWWNRRRALWRRFAWSRSAFAGSSANGRM